MGGGAPEKKAGENFCCRAAADEDGSGTFFTIRISRVGGRVGGSVSYSEGGEGGGHIRPSAHAPEVWIATTHAGP